MKNSKKILAGILAAVMTASVAPMTVSAAWNRDANGSWSWSENGTKATGWKFVQGNWYYFDNNGTMATGWKNDGGKWYYLNESGAMATGWKAVNGKWYYLNNSGDMVTGWKAVNGKWYYMNTSGDMATGWLQDNGSWYYMDSWGSMATGWRLVNNTWYYMDNSGSMETGFFTVGDKTYFASSSGAMQTGVVEVNGDVYYFGEANDGAMKTGVVEIDGQTYRFNENGEAIGKKPTVDKAFNVSDSGVVTPTTPDERPSTGGSTGGSSSGSVTDPSDSKDYVSISAKAAIKDGGEEGTTSNIGKYTVSSSGTTITITENKPLTEHTAEEGPLSEGKWVGVLISTDVDVTALKYNGELLGEQDKADAESQGATDGKTFVLWLDATKLEDSDREITLEADGKDKTTVTIHFNSLADQMPQLMQDAWNYKYDDFTYTNDMKISGTHVDYVASMAEITEGAEESNTKATADLARYLGALYRVNQNGETYDAEITYNGKTYIWKEETGLKGSNWVEKDGSDTLVKAITTALTKDLITDKNGVSNLTLTYRGVTITASVSVEADDVKELSAGYSLSYDDEAMTGKVTRDENAEISDDVLNGSTPLDQEKVKTMGEGGEFVVYYTVPQDQVPTFDKIVRVHGDKETPWSVSSSTTTEDGSGWFGKDEESGNYYFKWGHVFAEKDEDGQYNLVADPVFDETLKFYNNGTLVATMDYNIDLSNVKINPLEVKELSDGSSLEWKEAMNSYVTRDETAEISDGEISQEDVAGMGQGGEFVVYYTVSKEELSDFDRIDLYQNGERKVQWDDVTSDGDGWYGTDGSNHYFKWGHSFASDSEGWTKDEKWNSPVTETLKFYKDDVLVATMTYTIDLSDVSIASASLDEE